MTSAYDDDLAYVHDVGFGNHARSAATELLKQLAKSRASAGRVVDLGCGSGILAEAVSAAGYDVLGFDLSPSMLELARRRAPRAEFIEQSCLSAKLPKCAAVTAIGEIFNYLFDPRNSDRHLARLFRRVYEALVPGGLFLFDVATPGRGGTAGHYRSYTEGTDWACLFGAEEDRKRQVLTRHITTFRQVGPLFRRHHETHRLRLLKRSHLAAELRAVGFRPRTLAGYGELKFPAGYVAFVARKEVS